MSDTLKVPDAGIDTLELLELLETMVFAAKVDCPRTLAWGNLLTACDAAIAKARGESNDVHV